MPISIVYAEGDEIPESTDTWELPQTEVSPVLTPDGYTYDEMTIPEVTPIADIITYEEPEQTLEEPIEGDNIDLLASLESTVLVINDNINFLSIVLICGFCIMMLTMFSVLWLK